jgi:hypothetical protein
MCTDEREPDQELGHNPKYNIRNKNAGVTQNYSSFKINPETCEYYRERDSRPKSETNDIDNKPNRAPGDTIFFSNLRPYSTTYGEEMEKPMGPKHQRGTRSSV